jgi:hypothetical protein
MQVSRINYNDFIAEKSEARRGSVGSLNHKSVGTQSQSMNATPKYSSYMEFSAYRGPKNFKAAQKAESISQPPNYADIRPKYSLNVVGDSSFKKTRHHQQVRQHNLTQTKLVKEI